METRPCSVAWSSTQGSQPCNPGSNPGKGIGDKMKELQEKIKQFCKEHGLEHKAEHHALDLASETGEIAKEILKMSDYGRKKLEKNENIESELGDALYSLITIANYFDVNLEKALELVLEKYEKRLKKGSAGSEND